VDELDFFALSDPTAFASTIQKAALIGFSATGGHESDLTLELQTLNRLQIKERLYWPADEPKPAEPSIDTYLNFSEADKLISYMEKTLEESPMLVYGSEELLQKAQEAGLSPVHVESLTDCAELTVTTKGHSDL